MPRKIEFTLPEPTILLNVYLRMHHRKRTRYMEQLARQVWVLTNGMRTGSPYDLCEIKITRGSPKLPDWDGLYGGLKPLLDTFVVSSKRNPHGIGLIVDDNPNVIKNLIAQPVLAKRPGYTHVLIEER